MPMYGLAVSSIAMQIFLIIVVTAKDFYMASLSITGMMILPAYLFSGLYLWKTTLHPEELGLEKGMKNTRFRLTGIACSLYCLWMIYSGGVVLLLLTSCFYIAGIGFYIKARREAEADNSRELLQLFDPVERIVFLALAACSILSVFLILTGQAEI